MIAAIWGLTWPLNPVMCLQGSAITPSCRSGVVARNKIKSIHWISFSHPFLMPAIGIFFSLHSQICSYVSVKLGKPTTLANHTSKYLFKNAKSCLLMKSGLWLFASLRSSYRLKPGAQLCRQHGFTLRLCYSWKRPTLLIPFPNVNKPNMVLVHSSLLWVVTSPILIQDVCWNEAGGLSCLTQRYVMFCLLISGSGEQFYKAN